jgi:hypothetical protein
MAVAIEAKPASTGILHIFNKLSCIPNVKCELCRDQRAAFQWSKQQDDRLLREAIPVCSTCAGMIVLVGKEH